VSERSANDWRQFWEEREMYDNSPQPYAQVFIMDADGTHVRQLTESRWEDSMPVYVPSPQSRSTR